MTVRFAIQSQVKNHKHALAFFSGGRKVSADRAEYLGALIGTEPEPARNFHFDVHHTQITFR